MAEPKFDCSFEEMRALGLIDNNGRVLTDSRYQHDLYYKEVERREAYRNNPELLKLGIVDANGKVLDEKKLQEYNHKKYEAERLKYEAEMRQHRIEQAALRKQRLETYRRILKKIFGELAR